MTNELAELDVFYGELTTSRALVYARLPRPAGGADWKLGGQIRGPRCKFAQTLPLTAPLVDLGPGPTLLARALVPEPSFWSSDLPAIYDVTVNLQRSGELLSTARREIGLRSVGVDGRRLVLQGKNCVVRGVAPESTQAVLPRRWHEAFAAYVAGDADLEPLAEASHCGALAIVFVLEDRQSDTLSRIRKLSHYPAAAIAVVDGPLPDGFDKRNAAPNLLIGQWISPENMRRPERWAELLVLSADKPNLLAEIAAIAQVPIIAARFLEDRSLNVEAARGECDSLQRDLASIGQFAGYIV